ncbi:MAG: thymidine phosphorylase [Thermoanaerobaculia bacterium]
MTSTYEILNRKRGGKELPPALIDQFIAQFTAGEIADYQMSAFLMATAIQGMTPAEMTALTSAVTRSGEMWQIREEFEFIADKHSTGGVGDKISLALAPLVAACGVPIGMLSGRGLGHTGGTLDKLESIPGFRAGLSRAELVDCVRRCGCAIGTSTAEIAPADRRMYALRDVTGTVESVPLITASIMSKKLAFGASFLLLDVKTGSGAFMASRESAWRLARSLMEAASGSGMKIEAMITNMDRPLGATIGNAIEVTEAIRVLAGRGPGDILALTRAQAERILLAAGISEADARARIDRAISSGSAVEKAAEWIEAQGGDPSFIDDPSKLGRASHSLEVKAPRGGSIDTIDSWRLGMIGIELGAGRRRQEDEVDPTAGIELLANTGDPVEKGAPIARLLWSRPSVDGEELAARYLEAVAITDDPPLPAPLVHEIMTEETDAA